MADNRSTMPTGPRLPASPYAKWQLECGILALTLYVATWLNWIAWWYVTGHTRMEFISVWPVYLVRWAVNVGAVSTTWCILSLLYIRRLDIKWVLAFGLSALSWWGSMVMMATDHFIQK